MMDLERVPYVNDSDKPVYVGAILVPANGCRDVFKADLPPAPSVDDEPDADHDADVVGNIVALSVREAESHLANLTDTQLEQLVNAENQKESPRSSFVDAVNAEIIMRGSNELDG